MDLQREECAICFDKPANCVVVPCGHQCGCEPCLNRLRSSQNKCPICRCSISSIMKVKKKKKKKKKNDRYEEEEEEEKKGKKSEINVATPKDLPDISLEVLPLDVTDKREDGTNAVIRISVSEPEERSLSRLPVDVVTVIDISGSMGSAATYEVDGEVRSDGLKILDIAVHAVKVILASLRKEDRFALVTFNQHGELKYPMKNMTERNRKEAVKVASGLRHHGQTNIWAGIEKGMDSLRKAKIDSKYSSRNQVVLLLTDGRPTTTPRGGHVQAFGKYCRKYNFECQLSCFGFGYSLDSKLMLEMSEAGSGTFAFIPMAPVLGTVFTHALASVLSTYTTNSKLILTASKSGSFVTQNSKGGLQMNLKKSFWSEKLEIDVGPLLYGQTRDIVVPMRFNNSLEKNKVFIDAKLVLVGGGKKVLTAKGKQLSYDSNAEVAKIRALVSDTLLEIVSLGEGGKMYEAKTKLTDLVKMIEESDEAYNERVVGLKNDITGRCTKALDGIPRFNRWGKHYLRALLRAHSVQQCTNNLDIGVQVYGGTLFAMMRQRGDEIFLTLPPPQRSSGISYTTTTTTTATTKTSYTPRPTPAPVNMNRYTGGGGGGGGCFGAESTVVVVSSEEGVSSTTTVRVADVKKGDIVKVYGNRTAEVVCVVEAIRKDPKPLVAIPGGGPFITSKHPLRINGGCWRMPEGMGPMVEAGGNGTVYNFVLEPKNAILLVNGYECVTLGHGLKGKVVEHAFYGTERSLTEVRKLKGWRNGRVSIEEIVRDKLGHAKGFK